MLKVMHVHKNGKICYAVSRGKEKDWGFYQTNGQEFIAGYNSYSAMWHAYDPATGHEIASFRREFYEKHIEMHKVADMVRDPDCIAHQND